MTVRHYPHKYRMRAVGRPTAGIAPAVPESELTPGLIRRPGHEKIRRVIEKLLIINADFAKCLIKGRPPS
jgi:hypothetical protein